MSVQRSIEEKIRAELRPTHLSVINESNKHNVPADSETHFKVVVVSGQFESLRPLQRHRMVNTILASELQNSVHALSIVAMAPQQWDEKAAIPPSPPCLGGDGSLPSKKSSKESS